MSDGVFGWTGRILRVDLSSSETQVLTLPLDVYSSWIGGKGLAGYFLAQAGVVTWDDPHCPLLFFTGPLVGTGAPTSGRMTVMSRSPLTGGIGDASVGGGFGTRLKRAGYDGLVITGRGKGWTGLEISSDELHFTDAKALVSEETPEVFDVLEGKGSVAAIGPAAHRGVRFASVMVDRHYAAARNGLGLCMAAKNLKYVSVRGDGKIQVKDKGSLEVAKADVERLVAASSVLTGEQGIRELGTVALYDLMHNRRMMPTDNFRRTFFEEAPNLNAHSLRRAYSPKKVGCHGCKILCKKKSSKGVHLPEFETLSHFTALIENADLDLAVRANTLCNRMGMDTISAAVTLACYREVEGVNPKDPEGLLLDMARAKGVGAVLSQGSYVYAESRGAVETSMSVKKQELPAYDPRGAYGMALAYATSTRGGCHLRAYPIGHEILRRPVATDRFSFAGKARIIKIAEDVNALVDSITACKFVFLASTLEEYAHLMTAATGVEMTATDLSRVGERIYVHERIMNASYGLGIDDDDLPPRFFSQPGTEGPGFDVPPIDRAQFLETRRRYYKIRGLGEDGTPLAKTVSRLGL